MRYPWAYRGSSSMVFLKLWMALLMSCCLKRKSCPSVSAALAASVLRLGGCLGGAELDSCAVRPVEKKNSKSMGAITIRILRMVVTAIVPSRLYGGLRRSSKLDIPRSQESEVVKFLVT